MIIWDKANKQLYEKIEGHQGDSNGRQLVVQILNNGKTVSLPHATLYLAWKSKSNKGFDVFETVDSLKAIYKLAYTTELLSNKGKVKASLVLVDIERRIESKPFNIHLIETVVDDDSVQSENSFTALTKALIRVENIEANEKVRENTFQENESNRIATFNANEDERKSEFNTNESHRESIFQDNEETRQQNENKRIDAESRREQSEINRQDIFEENESLRQLKEDERAENEDVRINSENDRMIAEKARNEKEAKRESAESGRNQSEEERTSNEANRIDEEEKRVRNENTRQINESGRVEAENERDSKYTQIEADYAERAETLEETYAPRLTNVENEIDNKNHFDERITIVAPTTDEADVGFLRFLRGDESVLALIATSDNGTGLNIHLYDGEEWTGLVKINEKGDLYTTGSIRAEGGII